MLWFGVQHTCPGCGKKIGKQVVKLTPHRRLETYSCGSCKSDFLKSRKSELIRILDDGLLLV